MGQGVLSSRHPSSGGVGIRQAGRRPPRRCCSPPPSPQRPRCPHPRPGLALAMSSSAWIFCDASTNQLRRRSQAWLSSASPLLCGVSGPTAHGSDGGVLNVRCRPHLVDSKKWAPPWRCTTSGRNGLPRLFLISLVLRPRSSPMACLTKTRSTFSGRFRAARLQPARDAGGDAGAMSGRGVDNEVSADG